MMKDNEILEIARSYYNAQHNDICGIMGDDAIVRFARAADSINNSENLIGLLLWALYNHQGANSTVGQPIRKALGIGQFDKLTCEQIEKAQIAAGIIDA